jgi:hypothetical protein
MRKSVEEYVRKCDSCQRKKVDRELRVLLGQLEEPEAPFQVTAMDITGPYPLTQLRNKNLLTFIDHFMKWVEAFPIPDQTTKTCDRIYVSQIITRHRTGSKLITDQVLAFISAFLERLVKYRVSKESEHQAYIPSLTENWNAGTGSYIRDYHIL